MTLAGVLARQEQASSMKIIAKYALFDEPSPLLNQLLELASHLRDDDHGWDHAVRLPEWAMFGSVQPIGASDLDNTLYNR